MGLLSLLCHRSHLGLFLNEGLMVLLLHLPLELRRHMGHCGWVFPMSRLSMGGRGTVLSPCWKCRQQGD